MIVTGTLITSQTPADSAEAAIEPHSHVPRVEISPWTVKRLPAVQAIRPEPWLTEARRTQDNARFPFSESGSCQSGASKDPQI